MKLKVVTPLPRNPVPSLESTLLLSLEQHGEEVAVMAQLEGIPMTFRYILTIGEKGLWRSAWAEGLGLPTGGEGRIVDCTKNGRE